MSPLDVLLEILILASQHTPFRGRGGGFTHLPKDRQDAPAIEKARAEAADSDRIFGLFPEDDLRALLRERTVLDFGSGYGGRTVEYAQLGAAAVHGVEPVAAHVEAGRQLASERGVDNVFFERCTDYEIPYRDETFDVAISFDVLEHVADPRRSMNELRRVLKPGGRLFAVFPVYRGMFSHHLDYLTLAPAFHVLFGARRTLRVVNHLLDTRFTGIRVTRHRQVSRSYLDDRDVLPTLNGLGLQDFRELAAQFHVQRLEAVGVGERVFGRGSLGARILAPLMNLPPTISEIFTYHVRAVLRRAT